MKTPNNGKIMQALKLPISGVKPISAQFITTAQPKKKMLIEPQKQANEFDEAGKKKAAKCIFYYTMDELISKCDLELTESALKQIGL
jgi:hypothetical protein